MSIKHCVLIGLAALAVIIGSQPVRVATAADGATWTDIGRVARYLGSQPLQAALRLQMIMTQEEIVAFEQNLELTGREKLRLLESARRELQMVGSDAVGAVETEISVTRAQIIAQTQTQTETE